MDKFTILFLVGAFSLVCLAWSDSVKEDTTAYKVLAIPGYGAFAWFFVYGLYHVVMKLLEN